jgi:N-methylhydantoinase A
MEARGVQLGVDIGGTFTDFVLVDPSSGSVRIEKVPSRQDELERYFFEGVDRLGVPLAEIEAILHGSTVAINAILQEKGEPVGVLTTAGFRDSLEICRGTRKEIYNLAFRNPPPLVPRRLRREVSERLDAHGEVVRPLDLDEVRREIAYLAEQRCKAIAVVFLHAYRNPVHERAAGVLITQEFPDLLCFLSHEVAPEWREYERTSTVVLNSYVAPPVARYLDTLEHGLEQRGHTNGLKLIQSTGGSTSAASGRRAPIRTLESGPAGGVIATARLATLLERTRVIAADVGGTSFDVALVLDGRPSEKSQTEISYRPVLAPTIDITSIGAGGGSIAWVDAGGGLNVGPQSAQATPGPACFGRGGTQPTVTDAYVVLGLINPEYFLGSRMQLDRGAADAALEQNVAVPLAIDVEAAADAVVRLASMNMVLAIRNITIERGYDPREFTLVPYGGGGGMFASLIARELEIAEVIVPTMPANFSAWGIVNSDYRFDAVRHLRGDLTGEQLEKATVVLAELETSGREALVDWGHDAAADVSVEWWCDMRYVGQEHSLKVPIEENQAIDSDSLRNAFEQLHAFQFSHSYDDQPVELVNCRVAVSGIRPKPAATHLNGHTSTSGAVKTTRPVRFPGGTRVDATIYDRERLAPGTVIRGPAVIEEWTSTILAFPGDTVTVDDYGNLRVTPAPWLA